MKNQLSNVLYGVSAVLFIVGFIFDIVFPPLYKEIGIGLFMIGLFIMFAEYYNKKFLKIEAVIEKSPCGVVLKETGFKKMLIEDDATRLHEICTQMPENTVYVPNYETAYRYFRLLTEFAKEKVQTIDVISIDDWFNATDNELISYLQKQGDRSSSDGLTIERIRIVKEEEIVDKDKLQHLKEFISFHKKHKMKLILCRPDKLTPLGLHFKPQIGYIIIDPKKEECVCYEGVPHEGIPHLDESLPIKKETGMLYFGKLPLVVHFIKDYETLKEKAIISDTEIRKELGLEIN